MIIVFADHPGIWTEEYQVVAFHFFCISNVPYLFFIKEVLPEESFFYNGELFKR